MSRNVDGIVATHLMVLAAVARICTGADAALYVTTARELSCLPMHHYLPTYIPVYLYLPTYVVPSTYPGSSPSASYTTNNSNGPVSIVSLLPILTGTVAATVPAPQHSFQVTVQLQLPVMVLQEVVNAAPTATDAFADDPASDRDPYATDPSSSAPASVRLNLDDFPKPVPIFGPLVGYTRAQRSKYIHDACNAASTIMKRPVTQDEAYAIAYHTTKAQRTTSYGLFLGTAAGAYRAYQTATTLRFPFYNPTPEIQERIRASMKTQTARMAWHSMRASLYMFGLGAVGGLVATSYGASVAAVAMQRDPRLTSFYKALTEIGRERRTGLPREATPAPGQSPPQPRTGWPATASTPEDDMSPTGGFGARADAATDTGILSDQQMRSNAASQRPDARTSPIQNRENTFRMDKMATPPRDFDLAYDDASPTAGVPPLDTAGASSGSAWDRIRHQAAGAGQQVQAGSRAGAVYRSAEAGRGPPVRGLQREQREGATFGDSFTFSATEEERQFAKAEAQREFDARIERERRGRDFEDSGKRW